MDRPTFGNTTRQAGASEASNANGEIDLTQTYNRLREEHARLNEQRVRRTVMLQNAIDEEEKCRKEAEAFGASTPEDLERILEQRREETARQLADFEKALAEEAQLQSQIEQDLAAAEKR